MPDTRSRRLEPRSTEAIDRSTAVAFDFEGSRVEAFAGDTIGSALYASGLTIFSRSFKYHRPRGLLCVAGRCPNCLVAVDGIPNVRACTEVVQAGMRVSRQNAWPSADHDFLAVLDRLDRFMPVGFYYKALHRPKLLWSVAEPFIRRVGGLGSIDIHARPSTQYHHENRHVDVAVVGGGPAGMSAALEAARSELDVLLIDDQAELGGHLRYDPNASVQATGVDATRGADVAIELSKAVRSAPNIEVLDGATAFGLYEDNLLAVHCGRRMVRIRARRIVAATGAQEVPVVHDSNDLPGVMLTTGVLRLIHLYGIKPGNVAVIATNNDQAYRAACDLMDAGVKVAALADLRPGFPEHLKSAATLRSRGILVLPGHAITAVKGRRRVQSAIVAPIEGGGLIDGARSFDCDLVAVSGGLEPATSLLQQAKLPIRVEGATGEMAPSDPTRSVFAAGGITGAEDPGVAVLQGRIAAAEAAGGLGSPTAKDLGELDRHKRDLAAAKESREVQDRAAPAAAVFGAGKKRFVCLCEDVTVSDVADAIAEGFEDIQTLKRYTTASMGPCQGKMCLKAVRSIAAAATGTSVEDVGTTTSRPPVQPVPLGVLAGPSHLPIKRTPMDRKHRDLGAPMVDLGPWQRAYSYTTPQEECVAVRERVGIIDVSTLGKLDVLGGDAPALLDKVYTHRFSDLRVGRIRYGVLCSDTGAILDDGTVTRLADDRYFVTTTTGNVELIEEWFKWWLAGTGMCAHVNNTTAGYAAINVAGPMARNTLAKLTDVDLSVGKFRYMRSKQGKVAGVPCIFLRIGFVGETGWELHFPSEYGEYMWDALMDAGREYGIAPFGLEAQRILRLEKKHIIVNQDTDSVTNPLESDMEWVVRFEKEDFIGRGGLLAANERGHREKLVGFVMRDGHVPPDGAAVSIGGRPVGRVTSSRRSPTLTRGIGLAWVPSELATEGRDIDIRINEGLQPARVTLKPFYDPEGARLRQ